MRRAILAAAVATTAILAAVPGAVAATPRVLRVGSYHGIPGQYSSIQKAVDAARPGDIVLVGPGDYKTRTSKAPKGHPEFAAGVLITTPRLTVRGMNRHTVIVDGTRSGSACNALKNDQNYGPRYQGSPSGLNGVEDYKANDVTVENMTVCNFLGGSGDAGNEVWWNGGANSGIIGGYGYLGSYLTTTSTYFGSSVPSVQAERSAAEYGVFSSNWDGGSWNQIYGSNMNDSGFYIGACQQQCNQVVDHAWGEYNALGYSGSNSGGSLVVENSQFDNNEDGFDTNSQNGDNPPPQNGECPNGGISPITHTHSCWVFMHNYVHDNNNPDVPAAGSAAAGPVGTGMSISGGRYDTVMDNTFAHNDAWGNIFVPYPDSGPPCTGGTQTGAACIYDDYGDALIDNTYTDNGSYGNPTNGDFGWTSFETGATPCFSGNVDTDGNWTSAPADLQSEYPTCDGKTIPPSDSSPEGAQFTAEVACDSQADVGPSPIPCPPGSNYPKATKIVMHPLPPARELPTMPHVCGGIPASPWCSGETTTVRGCAAPTVRVPLSTGPRERIRSVSVRVNGRRVRTSARGGSVRVPLGHRSGRRRVRVAETMKVGRHTEHVTFTRVYRRC